MNNTKKTIAFWIGVGGAVVALVGLIVYIAYVAQGGKSIPWVYILVIVGIAAQAGLYFYDGAFSGLISAVSPIMFMISLGLTIRSDYGNIVDKLNGIRMYGNPDLAGLNFAIAAIFLVAIFLTIVTCFMRYQKKEN